MLVGVANGRASTGRAEISLPESVEVSSVKEVLYGDERWVVESGKLVKNSSVGLEVSLLVLNIA